MPFPGSCRVKQVDPVDGWALYEDELWISPRTQLPSWYAVRGDEEVLLNLSSYFFTPTQVRLAWLVRHGFPTGVICPRYGEIGPLSDATIDAAIKAEEEGREAQNIINRVRRYAPALQAACIALVVVGATSVTLIAGAAL